MIRLLAQILNRKKRAEAYTVYLFMNIFKNQKLTDLRLEKKQKLTSQIAVISDVMSFKPFLSTESWLTTKYSS